jgi:PIN like domain
MCEELRKNGVNVEPHSARFRHNTEDVDWLPVVGEKKWVVLTADVSIGRRPLELDALLVAGVKAFAPTQAHLTGREMARLFLDAMPQILRTLEENRFPFIAKIHHDGSVSIWKTDVEFPKGYRGKKRYRPSKSSKGK